MELSKKIKQIRNENKLTQEQFAEIMNVSQNYIANIECGKANMSLAKVLELSKALNVDIESLLTFK